MDLHFDPVLGSYRALAPVAVAVQPAGDGGAPHGPKLDAAVAVLATDRSSLSSRSAGNTAGIDLPAVVVFAAAAAALGVAA